MKLHVEVFAIAPCVVTGQHLRKVPLITCVLCTSVETHGRIWTDNDAYLVSRAIGNVVRVNSLVRRLYCEALVSVIDCRSPSFNHF